LIPLAVQEAAYHDRKHLEGVVDSDVMDNFFVFDVRTVSLING